MGCASGKKPSAECKSPNSASSEAVLNIQVPISFTISELQAGEGPGEPAPVSQLLLSEDKDRPKAVKTALPPKKTLIQPQSHIEVQSYVPAKPKIPAKTATQPLAICPSPIEPSLASAKDITGSKAAFDSHKFRLANTSPLSLPEGQGGEKEAVGPKPMSSLTISIRPQAPLFTGSGIPVVVRPAKASLNGTSGSTIISDSR